MMPWPLLTLAVGDTVTFYGFGALRTGTLERIGPKNLTVSYITPTEAARASESGYAPHVMRRAIKGGEIQAVNGISLADQPWQALPLRVVQDTIGWSFDLLARNLYLGATGATYRPRPKDQP